MASAGLVETIETLAVPTATIRKEAEPETIPFDVDFLKAKYLEERDRRLKNGGLEQYRPVDAGLDDTNKDPYTAPLERDPIELNIDVVIIGGGYGGQLVAAHLLEQGVTNFRIIDKAGDFGGTWYWNRYPGAQCDVESYVYMPLLEKTEYIPTEKYAHGSELLAYARRIGEKLDLYSRAVFQTEVKALRWDETTATWSVETSRNDTIRARFVIPVAGLLHLAKLPDLPGIEIFQGESFHSSRWNYDYTGGSSAGCLSKLSNKKVGIIGTGATAVQIIPYLGSYAQELYVFQRTPSIIDVRGNKVTDYEWARSLQKGWQQHRMDNFATIVSGGYAEEDLVADGWTDIFKTLRPHADKFKRMGPTPELAAAKLQLADFQKMDQIRGRVDTKVENSDVANSLKPWYNYFCKRPCCHDQYLDTFNLPNVELVDTRGDGVEAITPKGIMANGKEYEVDLIVYATGFDYGTDWTKRAGLEIYGRDGLTMTEKWSQGASTFHGWATRGFPNCFLISLTQSGQTPNFIHVTNEVAKLLAYVVSKCDQDGVRTIEPTEEAENDWVNTVIEKGQRRKEFLSQCTPGYLNNEGRFDLKAVRNTVYGGGPLEFLDIVKKWMDNDKFEGMDTTMKETNGHAK